MLSFEDMFSCIGQIVMFWKKGLLKIINSASVVLYEVVVENTRKKML